MREKKDKREFKDPTFFFPYSVCLLVGCYRRNGSTNLSSGIFQLVRKNSRFEEEGVVEMCWTEAIQRTGKGSRLLSLFSRVEDEGQGKFRKEKGKETEGVGEVLRNESPKK